MNWTQRTSLLIGDQALEKLEHSSVLIVGLGGVGAYVAEFLARAGIGRLILVDGDKVQATNRNRQLPALCSTEGCSKVEVVAQRLGDINPEIRLHYFPLFLEEEEPLDLLYGLNRFCTRISSQINRIIPDDDYWQELNTSGITAQTMPICDFVVDAIDSLGPKAALIRACLEHKIPLISSMGAGARLDPSQISTCDISKTHQCALARALRHRLRAFGISKGFPVVFSSEQVTSKANTTEKQTTAKAVPGTISYLPAAFACHLAAYTIKYLISEKISSKSLPD